MILENIQQKILKSDADALHLVSQWKNNHETVVFSNGCFDLLHPGHVIYLAKAAELGTKLIVAINTDTSVQQLKGKNRPLLDENARCLMMASLGFVDAVVLFDDDTPLRLIKLLLPNVLVKGKDYAIEEIAGHDVVLQNGGKVETIEIVPGYSTSAIEEKILGRKGE